MGRGGLILLVCLWSVVQGQQETMPEVAEGYSTIVSAVSSTGGWTDAYVEHSDAIRGLLLFQGKLVEDNVFVGADINANVMYSFTREGVGSAAQVSNCFAVKLSNRIREREFSPSSQLLNAMRARAPVYMGQSVVRDIACDYWQHVAVVVGGDGSVTNTTQTAYLARNQFSLARRVPVRLHTRSVTVAAGGTMTLSEQLLEFVAWRIGAPDEDVLGFPDKHKCTALTDYAFVFPSEVSTVAPAPTGNPAVPIWPTAFTATLESEVYLPDKFQGSEPVAYDWSLDGPHSRDRLTPLVAPKLPYQPYFPTYVGFYESLFAARDPRGQLFTLSPDNSCLVVSLGGSVQPPLASVRDGLPYQVFGQFTGWPEAASLTWTFQGRQPVRGVIADSWVSSEIDLTRHGRRSIFRLSVAWWPEGWRFPGRRGASDGERVPLQVVARGTESNGANATAFENILDFFRFVPIRPSALLFDIDSFGRGCQVPSPASPPTYSGGVVGGSFAAGLVIGGSLFSVVFYCLYKRRGSTDKQSVELPARSDEHSASQRV